MDECAPFLAHFASEHVHFAEDHSNFFLEEKSPEGAGKTYFATNDPCIVINARPPGPLLWSLKNRKISEGSILTRDENGYHLHILEMKSKLTQTEWAKAVLQFEGMLLTTLAVVRLLGVHEVASVTCYIAYKQAAMGSGQSADMIFLKTFVGMPNPVSGASAWTSEKLELPITGTASIRKAQRDEANNAHFGNIG
jgi:hypothetical protein